MNIGPSIEPMAIIIMSSEVRALNVVLDRYFMINKAPIKPIRYHESIISIIVIVVLF